MIDVIGMARRGGRELVAHIDFPLLLITLAIMAVGLATVHSATIGGNPRAMARIISLCPSVSIGRSPPMIQMMLLRSL